MVPKLSLILNLIFYLILSGFNFFIVSRNSNSFAIKKKELYGTEKIINYQKIISSFANLLNLQKLYKII